VALQDPHDSSAAAHVVTLGQNADTPAAAYCSALSLSASTQQAYLVGDTTAGGLMTEFANSSTSTQSFGFVAQATIQEGATELQRTGGYLLKEDVVPDHYVVVTYPFSYLVSHLLSLRGEASCDNEVL
jgi:hypothetical protein